MNKLIIGENIWRLRKLKKITQEQLGEYIGVSKGAISKWESGVSYPDIELLPVLARFFEISIDELLNFNSKISKELEDEIYLECKNAINEEHTENGIELCKSYLIKYTNNYDLKFKLVALMTIGCAFIKNEEEIKRIYGKAINIYEEIVNNSLNEEIVELSKL
ncbi:MAG: helix-turn-helix transcriptional regulator, partial [Peptostreptococcaceae bacterium]